jgi:hypothetical protein
MTARTSRSSTRRTVHRLVTLIPPAIFGLAAAVTLAGCPVGAELEDPERFAIGTGGTGPGTGGTGPATGGTAGSGTAGSGTAGSGTAGTGGGMLEVTCDGVDYVEVMNKNCAVNSGCHKATGARLGVADLNLTPDAGLVMRLKDMPAGFKEIDCGAPGPYMECIPAGCPTASGALLVNSLNPDESWILKKLNATHGECGFEMPQSPGTTDFDAVRKACVEKVIRAIAAL